MSTQIAIRLPDEVVEFIDEQVRSGNARSRAAVVSRSIARDARRQRAEQDIVRLLAEREAGGFNEFDDLAAMASRTMLDID